MEGDEGSRASSTSRFAIQFSCAKLKSHETCPFSTVMGSSTVPEIGQWMRGTFKAPDLTNSTVEQAEERATSESPQVASKLAVPQC